MKIIIDVRGTLAIVLSGFVILGRFNTRREAFDFYRELTGEEAV